MLDFLSRDRVIPVVSTPRDIRDGIAHYYDRVEDRDVAMQLGIDPESQGGETNPVEAQRLAKERPVVRIVQTLIADAVTRRASDIHLRPGERGWYRCGNCCARCIPRWSGGSRYWRR